MPRLVCMKFGECKFVWAIEIMEINLQYGNDFVGWELFWKMEINFENEY